MPAHPGMQGSLEVNLANVETGFKPGEAEIKPQHRLTASPVALERQWLTLVKIHRRESQKLARLI